MSLDLQAYTTKAPIIDQEDEDTYNTTLVDVDETLFWGQFNVAHVLEQFDYDEIINWVHGQQEDEL